MNQPVFSITARTSTGAIVSYRFYGDDLEKARREARGICDAAGFELIRVTKLGMVPNHIGEWR